MKKLFLSALVAVIGVASMNAQEALKKGSKLIEVNTGSFATGNTSFGLNSTDGYTEWSVGAEAGYFVMDGLAIKLGLGYADADEAESQFKYKVGAKYYIAEQFPVGVDFTGVLTDGESYNFIGLQGGYAWFVANNVSVEPTVRYNLSLDDDKSDSLFQGLIGFAFHF